MNETNSDIDDEAVAQAASDWFVKLSSETATEADWTAFAAWLDASPRHQRAFEAVERLWVDLEAVPAEALVRRDLTVVALPARSRRRTAWAPAAMAAGLAAAVGAGWLLLQPGAQVVETGPGQSQVIALQTGGEADLSASTRLVLRRTASGEEARLERGSARFSVAHDPRRRFVVSSGRFIVTDVGTVFQVVALESGVKVAVLGGAVAVTAPNGSTSTVSAGQTYLADGAAAPTITAAPSTGAEPAHSSLVLTDQPLRAVADGLTRRFQRPVRVDQDAENLRFTGVLMLDSEGAVVRRLERFLPISAEMRDQVIVLHRRAGGH